MRQYVKVGASVPVGVEGVRLLIKLKQCITYEEELNG